MQAFDVEIHVAQQKGGLWRATVPGLDGCFVDAPTLRQAISDVQEVAAMHIDLLQERHVTLPDSVTPSTEPRLVARLPVNLAEYDFDKRGRPSRSVSH